MERLNDEPDLYEYGGGRGKDGTAILANFSSSMRNDIEEVEPIPGQSWIVR